MNFQTLVQWVELDKLHPDLIFDLKYHGEYQ